MNYCYSRSVLCHTNCYNEHMLGSSQPTTPSPLHTAFFTVTPVSKALALLLFIALPVVAFYFGLNKGMTPDHGPAPKITEKNSESKKTTSEDIDPTKIQYVNSDYQFVTTLHLDNHCKNQNKYSENCQLVKFSDPALVPKTTPIFALEDVIDTLTIYTTPQITSSMTKVGTTPIGGKTATVYYHQRGFEESWILIIPTTANRWLHLSLPLMDETRRSDSPSRTMADFEKYVEERKPFADNLLGSLRFLDTASVTADAPKWTSLTFAGYSFKVPYDAVETHTDTTLQLAFPKSQDGSENQLQFTVFDKSDLVKNSAQDVIAGIAQTYSLGQNKPAITQLSPQLALYTYTKTVPAPAIFAAGATTTQMFYFLVDEQNSKVIEAKFSGSFESVFMPTGLAIVKSIAL